MKKLEMKKAAMKKLFLRFPRWLVDWAREHAQDYLPRSPKLRTQFRKLADGLPYHVPSSEELRPFLEDMKQHFAAKHRELEAKRAKSLKRRPSPDERLELLEEQQRQHPQPPTGRPASEVNLLDSGPLGEDARKGKENRRQADEPRTKEAGDTPAQEGGTDR